MRGELAESRQIARLQTGEKIIDRAYHHNVERNIRAPDPFAVNQDTLAVDQIRIAPDADDMGAIEHAHPILERRYHGQVGKLGLLRLEACGLFALGTSGPLVNDAEQGASLSPRSDRHDRRQTVLRTEGKGSVRTWKSRGQA